MREILSFCLKGQLFRSSLSLAHHLTQNKTVMEGEDPDWMILDIYNVIMYISQSRCWIFTQMNTRLWRIIHCPDLMCSAIYRCLANFQKEQNISHTNVALASSCSRGFAMFNNRRPLENDYLGSVLLHYSIDSENGPLLWHNFPNVTTSLRFLSSGFDFIGWTLFLFSFSLVSS